MSKLVPPHGKEKKLKPLLLEGKALEEEKKKAKGLKVVPITSREASDLIMFLFEIATDSPGFASDETPETLGLSLRLPPWLENQRTLIEAELPFIDV